MQALRALSLSDILPTRAPASVTETARRMRTIEGNVKVLQYRALKYARQLHEDDSADGEGDKEEQSP